MKRAALFLGFFLLSALVWVAGLGVLISLETNSSLLLALFWLFCGPLFAAYLPVSLTKWLTRPPQVQWIDGRLRVREDRWGHSTLVLRAMSSLQDPRRLLAAMAPDKRKDFQALRLAGWELSGRELARRLDHRVDPDELPRLTAEARRLVTCWGELSENLPEALASRVRDEQDSVEARVQALRAMTLDEVGALPAVHDAQVQGAIQHLLGLEAPSEGAVSVATGEVGALSLRD